MSDEQKLQDELEAQAAEVEETLEAAEDLAEQNNADELVQALAAAQAEVAELKDQALRAQAEVQNIRRRADADVEKAHKFGVEKFSLEMLTTVDNLERALASCVAEDEATQAIRAGVEMTLNALLASLAKFQVQILNPEGEPFNPELHQAITMIDNPDVAPNTVLNVMQKGYTLSGRILRPAMVVVNKGAAQINENA